MFKFFCDLGDALTFLILKALQIGILIFGICLFVDGIIRNS